MESFIFFETDVFTSSFIFDAAKFKTVNSMLLTVFLQGLIPSAALCMEASAFIITMHTGQSLPVQSWSSSLAAKWMDVTDAHKSTMASASVRREFFVLSVFLAIPAEPYPLFIKNAVCSRLRSHAPIIAFFPTNVKPWAKQKSILKTSFRYQNKGFAFF